MAYLWQSVSCEGASEIGVGEERPSPKLPPGKVESCHRVRLRGRLLPLRTVRDVGFERIEQETYR